MRNTQCASFALEGPGDVFYVLGDRRRNVSRAVELAVWHLALARLPFLNQLKYGRARKHAFSGVAQGRSKALRLGAHGVMQMERYD